MAAAAPACPATGATTVCEAPGNFGYTVPRDAGRIRFTVIGAGGAGGRFSFIGGGGGGSARAAITCTVTGLQAGTVLNVTVPAGGGGGKGGSGGSGKPGCVMIVAP
ncbi:hypothetical protein ACIGXM_02885 [Kitasatospora sp. NPDC052896]|uniref:glycine-rich domain-containing protein n=1 Tax=Kitasatospora sp. NPDC052896 TaxID=3364061 RepID=UPI0037C878F4